MPRAQHIQIRVSVEEKSLLQAAADQAGLKMSEYLRREAGIGKFGRADLRRLSKAPADRPPAKKLEPAVRIEGPDFEQRVKVMALRMPRRAAENLVRSEEAREREAS